MFGDFCTPIDSREVRHAGVFIGPDLGLFGLSRAFLALFLGPDLGLFGHIWIIWASFGGFMHDFGDFRSYLGLFGPLFGGRGLIWAHIWPLSACFGTIWGGRGLFGLYLDYFGPLKGLFGPLSGGEGRVSYLVHIGFFLA